MPIDILVYSIVSTLLFCSYYFLTGIFVYSLYHHMLTSYMHVHLLLYSYTLIGSSNSLDLHIQVFKCYLTDHVFGEDHRYLDEPSLYLISGIPTFFYSVVSLIFDILDSSLILFLYSYVITCGHSYVILQCYHVIIVII